MPREIRPWYHPHIDCFCLVILLLAGLGCWGGLEILRHHYFEGLYLFVPSAVIAFFVLRGLWRHRHPWIYETHKGRKIKVRRHFRDEYDVYVDGRCARVYAEMLIDGVCLYFSSIKEWQDGPMTKEERVDVLNILLEDFEADGTRVLLDGINLSDTPQVRAANQRWEREIVRNTRQSNLTFGR